jgi:hypothetical protein
MEFLNNKLNYKIGEINEPPKASSPKTEETNSKGIMGKPGSNHSTCQEISHSHK